MNDKIKNYLGVALIIVLFAFGYSVLSYSYYFSRNLDPSAFKSFDVSSEGKAIAAPDIAEISITVITEGGKDIVSLQRENTEKNNKIIEFLKSFGIEAKDIKTRNYNIQPRYQYFNCSNLPFNRVCPPPEITGYSINQTVSVKIRDFSKIGAILSEVVKSGANSVSGVSFTIDDITKIQNEARKEAILKAKEKAKMISNAAGFRLGRIISVQEGFSSPPIFFEKTFETAGIPAPSDQSSPKVEPGSEEITATITLKYEIR